MNNKLLLINIITLLYRASKLADPIDRPTQLLIDVCQSIKTDTTDLTIDKEGKMIGELKNIALEMIYAPEGTDYDLGELLQKIQIVCEYDETLFNAFRDHILIELSPEESKRSCVRLISQFKRYFREKEAKAIINQFAAKAKFKADEISDIGKFITEMTAALEPYRNTTEERDPAIICELNFDKDPDAVAEVFRNIQKSKSGGHVLKTGWQCVNKMLDGGVRLGETVLVSALQHNNKSGFTRNLFKHFCLYNTPTLINPNKKAALVHISFEDEMETNIKYFYRSLKENENPTVKITDEHLLATDAREMQNYVIGRLQSTGFKVVMMRINPSDWAYTDICNKIISLEADGYEVKALVVDYLAMIPTTGCIQGPAGVDIRDLFRRMRNFTSARKIAFVTPHQLSPDAKKLERADTLDFVKVIANRGYYSGSSQIDQEVDTEIYLHIEKVDGKSYQTIQRGKRRDGEIIPEKDKYAVLPFQPIGGLLDDVNGVDTSVPKPGAVSRAAKENGETDPFWMPLDLES